MSRRIRSLRGVGIFDAPATTSLPGIDQLPSVIDTLPQLPGGFTVPTTVPVTGLPDAPSRGFDSAVISVPLVKLEQGSLRLLLAPTSTQLPVGQPDGRTLAVQRHVNFWLSHYGYAPVPEDGRMNPQLCGALALLDQGFPADYEAAHGATLSARGFFGRDRGMGYTALFGMAGTPGRLLQDGCVLAGNFEYPALVKGSGLEGSSLPPPPAAQAPSIDPLVEAARREIITAPRVDPTAPPVDSGWGTLSLPPGEPLPPKTTSGGGGLTIPDKWGGGVPAKPPAPARQAASASASTSLVLLGLGVAAAAVLLLSGKKRK